MQATIYGEDDVVVGVRIVDNNGVEHEIEVEKEGGIYSHHDEENGYPDDPSEREWWEDEAVSYARRYARYYVAQETDHDTVPWDFDPDRFQTVREAIDDLSEEAFETHFGAYYRQMIGAFDDAVEQPTALPDRASPMNEYRQYRLDVYLDDQDRVDATSGIHTMYYAGVDDDRVVRGEDPHPDRDPDAQLQHVPVDTTFEGFREFVDYHLRCQIRDCYIGMGLEPPEEYRVLGPGLSKFTLKYMHFDMYPRYHEYDADVEGYRAEDTFNMGVFGKLLDLF